MSSDREPESEGSGADDALVTPARRRLLHQLAAAATGGFTLQALGSEEPVQTPFLVPPTSASPGSEDAGTFPVLKGEVGVVAPQHPYGHGLRYGVKTDGTDTTAEIINWRDSVSNIGTYSDIYQLKHTRCRAVLPAGVIRISQPRALLDVTRGPLRYGLTIEGEGIRLTTVIYDSASPGPLLFASNRIYGLTVRNLEFQAPNEPQVLQNWLVSESTGKQQYFTFENLGFGGAWSGGVRLSAVPGARGDTNSEYKFDRITIGGPGFSDGFLVDSNEEDLQSNQFLNYWFHNINTTMLSGTLIRLRRGGHVSINNLDVSGYQPKSATFVIDLPEIGSSDGSHSLMIRNARFEALSEHARFLRCRWERGNVAIDGYEDIIWRNTKHLNFDIRIGNAASDEAFGKFGAGTSAASAQYWFANARFTGIHRYTCRGKPGSDADNVPATIQYQNCEFCGPPGESPSRNVHSFVRFAADADKSLVFRPHVRFRACRIEAVPNHVTDWDLGVQGARASTTAPIKALRFGTTKDGRLPSGASTAIVLPPGAMVLRVTWILPAGGAPVASRAYRFELSNGYATPGRRETLAVFEGADFNVASSRVDLIAHDTIPWPLPNEFDPIRSATLVLSETRSPGVHPSAQCMVEYV